MRCHICNRVLPDPQFNTEHQDYDPCSTCLTVIQDTLDGFKDKAAADEDDFDDGTEAELREAYRRAGIEYEEE
jgi:hypothetical protein